MFVSPNDLLIAKCTACVDNTSLTLITDYLTKRLQCVKIRSTFSSYLEILRDVRQGSILGPILFNLFINDLVFHKGNRSLQFCRWYYHIFMFTCLLNCEEAHRKLSNNTYIVLNWFQIYSMVANPRKFQIIFLGPSATNNNITFIIENKRIKGTNGVKLLRITIDQKLAFTKLINNLSNTASNFLIELWQE